MTRFLLTLLALLTGLAATGGTAQARLPGVSDTEIGAVECGRGTVRSALCQQVAGEPTGTPRDLREREASRPQPVKPKVYIPSVQMRIDRAYE